MIRREHQEESICCGAEKLLQLALLPNDALGVLRVREGQHQQLRRFTIGSSRGLDDVLQTRGTLAHPGRSACDGVSQKSESAHPATISETLLRERKRLQSQERRNLQNVFFV